MSEEKNYLISDEEGNLFAVKDWEQLFELLKIEELEDLYIVTKYTHAFEEAMIELEERELIERVTEGTAPIEEIANSLDKMGEYIGTERVLELDKIVKELLDNKAGNIDNTIDPINFIHLN